MSYEGGSDSSGTSEGYDGGSESGSIDTSDASATDELYEGGHVSDNSTDELYEGNMSGAEAAEITTSGENADEMYTSEQVDNPGEADGLEDDEYSEKIEEAEPKKTDEHEEINELEDEENPENEENSEQDEEAVRQEINEKSEYSQEVNDKIDSVKELEVYQKAGLKEEVVDGKTALVRDDIDWEQKDEFGRTNRERVEEDGLVPYNKAGEKIELHHIGQKDDSPLAELTTVEHRGKGNDTILHDKTKESEINRSDFNKVKNSYWKARSSK